MKNLQNQKLRIRNFFKVFRNVGNIKNHNEVGKIIKEKKKYGFQKKNELEI